MAGRVPDDSKKHTCLKCGSKEISLRGYAESRESEDETEVIGYREYECENCGHVFKGGSISKTLEMKTDVKMKVE